MKSCRWNHLLSIPCTVLMLVVLLAAPQQGSAQATKIPVVSLKNFIDTQEWQLDVTWHSQDAFEDEEHVAKLDMTATARFILKQSDKKDAWGRWHTESVQSCNLAFTGSDTMKSSDYRIDYTRGSEPGGCKGGAYFEVGGTTPGYLVHCGVELPLKMTLPGTSAPSLVSLMTEDTSKPGKSQFCTGPLPNAGLTIRGSLVAPMLVPPISSYRPVPVGIQYVLQPNEPLAPLRPQKK